MVKSLSVMGITDSDLTMSSITGRAKTPITTSIGRGIQLEIKIGPASVAWLESEIDEWINLKLARR
ncbi:AlpA family phage regulatory protein [Lonsdalea quercina]|uniref:AlpA family phage regulatory protein n=1 Tax=Lonsdalea quercina TaxID=71657 RepID=UPI003F48022D